MHCGPSAGPKLNCGPSSTNTTTPTTTTLHPPNQTHTYTKSVCSWAHSFLNYQHSFTSSQVFTISDFPPENECDLPLWELSDHRITMNHRRSFYSNHYFLHHGFVAKRSSFGAMMVHNKHPTFLPPVAYPRPLPLAVWQNQESSLSSSTLIFFQSWINFVDECLIIRILLKKYQKLVLMGKVRWISCKFLQIC